MSGEEIFCCNSFKRARDSWSIYLVKQLGFEPFYEVKDDQMYTIFEIEYCPFCGKKLLDDWGSN